MPTYRDNKVTLTDSHSILIYLCEKNADKSAQLWPTDQIDRINVLDKLFYSGTLLFRRDSDAIVSEIFIEFGFTILSCSVYFSPIRLMYYEIVLHMHSLFPLNRAE